MSEKRFTLDNEENGLCRCILMNGEEIPTCEVVGLLNTLNDENEQLKKQNKRLHNHLHEINQIARGY